MKDDALVAILVPAEQSAELESFAMKPATLAEIKAWPCATRDDEIVLVGVLDEVQMRITTIEKMRKEIVAPLAESKKKIDALFKRLASPYEDAKASVKGKLAAAEDARRAEMRRLQLAAEEAAKAGDLQTAHAIKASAAEVLSNQGDASYSYKWTCEVEDLSKVPLAFLAVDEAKVKAYLEQYKKSEHAEPVPGLRFTRVASVRA